jgi:hypothetical protein
MLGWHFIIYRTMPDSPGESMRRIAEWQTGWEGMNWIDRLVTECKAVSLGGCGYPYSFKAQAKEVKDLVVKGPPDARHPWVFDHGDIPGPDWKGRTTLDLPAWEACAPDEWLDIDVWDES